MYVCFNYDQTFGVRTTSKDKSSNKTRKSRSSSPTRTMEEEKKHKMKQHSSQNQRVPNEANRQEVSEICVYLFHTNLN